MNALPRLAVVWCWLGIWAGSVGAATPENGDRTVVAGEELVLNGKATRSVWGFSVYDVSLFLDRPSRDAQTILHANRGPKRVRMDMLRAVEKEKFVGTVRESVDRNVSEDERKTFAAELQAFLGHLENGGDIQPGRVITIDYVPGEGTVLGLDGRHVGTIAGDDFYHVILRLWLGRPLQASLKEGLLGGASTGD